MQIQDLLFPTSFHWTSPTRRQIKMTINENCVKISTVTSKQQAFHDSALANYLRTTRPWERNAKKKPNMVIRAFFMCNICLDTGHYLSYMMIKKSLLILVNLLISPLLYPKTKDYIALKDFLVVQLPCWCITVTQWLLTNCETVKARIQRHVWWNKVWF